MLYLGQCLGGVGFDGQPDGKRAAPLQFAGDGDLTTQRLDDLVSDGQAQARAGLFGGEKRLENLR
jgi:hypothetical protein